DSRTGVIDISRPADKTTAGKKNVVNPRLAVDDHAQLACHRRLKPGSALQQAARETHVQQAHRNVADEHRAGHGLGHRTVSAALHAGFSPSTTTRCTRFRIIPSTRTGRLSATRT